VIVYPAIDMLGGRAVRLRRGRYDDVTVYNDDPADQARTFAEGGAELLHVVDLDGAASGEPCNLIALGSILEAVDVPVQFGGGVRSIATVEALFELGVSRVVLGTSVVTDPELLKTICERYPEGVVAGVDARGGIVAIHGWTQDSALPLAEVVERLAGLGVARLLYTNIDVDGMGTGIDAGAYGSLATSTTIPVIASGGVTSLDDVRALAELPAPGVDGVIVGRALYDGHFTLPEAIAAAGTERPTGAFSDPISIRPFHVMGD
jgi:phosphoribosylformimino-5-aminoimidazole carboxamide ribotide isomerase